VKLKHFIEQISVAKFALAGLTGFCTCPGLGWDRVNPHKKPGGDTAGLADPTWRNQGGIRYRVPLCSVLSGGAGWGEVNRCSGAHWALGVERPALCTPFFLPVLLLLLLISFAVLLTAFIPTHEFCLFLPILLPTPVGGWAIDQPRGPFLLAGAKPRQYHRIAATYTAI